MTKILPCLAGVLLLSSSLESKEDKPTPHLLQIGTGVYDIIHDPRNPMLQVEYRSFLKKCPYLRPLVSLMITDKASGYICGGIAGDIFLGKHFVLTPSFAPGIYWQGKGKDLHFPLEFRSSMELSYVFLNQSRFGGQFYHISNASLGHKNPGAEALVFYYSIPLFW